MQLKSLIVSAVTVSILGVPVVAAKNLSDISNDLTFLKNIVTQINQEEVKAKATDTRESGNELFPAMEGAKPILTPAQQKLLKRCVNMPIENVRCNALKCRLTGECVRIGR